MFMNASKMRVLCMLPLWNCLCWLKHLAYSVCLHTSLTLFKSHLQHMLTCLLLQMMLSLTSFISSLHLSCVLPPPVLPSSSLPSFPLMCRADLCVCVRSVMYMRWKPGGIKSSQGFAVVLVGSWSPLSRDQMGLGRSGTRPQALDNTASPAMCEHLFSSIKTVIWIFQSHFLMTALHHACMKSK